MNELMIEINGEHYAPRRLQAGDLPLLLPLVEVAGPALMRLVDDPAAHVMEVLRLADPLITTVAHLLDCPREAISRMPLHELLRLIEQGAVAWMAVNAEYLNDEVTPAIQRLAQMINGVAAMTSGQETS